MAFEDSPEFDIRKTEVKKDMPGNRRLCLTLQNVVDPAIPRIGTLFNFTKLPFYI